MLSKVGRPQLLKGLPFASLNVSLCLVSCYYVLPPHLQLSLSLSLYAFRSSACLRHNLPIVTIGLDRMSTMDNNWRAALAQDSRHKIVNRIMDTLQKHIPCSGEDGMNELWKIAARFEEKIFYAAQSQHDYLRKISLKMLTLETRTPGTNGALPTNSNPTKSLDSGLTVQHPPRTQGQPANPGLAQPQVWPQVSQSAQSGMTTVGGMQTSAGLTPSLSSVSSLPQQAPTLSSGQMSANPPPLAGSSLITTSNGQSLSQNLHATSNTQSSLSQNVLLASQRLQLQARQQQQQQQQPQQSQQPQQAQPQHAGAIVQQGSAIQQPVQQQQQQPISQSVQLQQPQPISLQQLPQPQPQPQSQSQPQSQPQPQQQLQPQAQPQPQPPQAQQLQQQLQAQSQSHQLQQQQQQPLQLQQHALMQQRLQQSAMLKQKLQQQHLSLQQQTPSLLQHQTVLQQPSSSLQQQPSLPQQQQSVLQSLQLPQQLPSQNNLQASQQQQVLLQAKPAQQQPTQAQVQQQHQASASLAALMPHSQQPPQTQSAHTPSLLSMASQQQSLLSQSQTTQQQQMQQQAAQTQPDQQQRLLQPGGVMQQQVEQHKQQPLQVQPQSTLDSLQAGQSGIIDPQEIVWTKMQVLKDKYLQDMTDLYHLLVSRSEQPMAAEQLQKLSHYKEVLKRLIPYLLAPKENFPKDFKIDKVEAIEKQIIMIMETFKRRKRVPQQQPTQQQPQQQPPAAPSAGATQVQGSQQTSHQLPQGLQQPQQVGAATTTTMDLSSNQSSNTSLPMLQGNASAALQQNITSTGTSNTLNGVQGTPSLGGMQGTGTGTLHQNSMPLFTQSNLTALQTNVSSIQQQQPQQQQQALQHEQQHLLQQRTIKDEQSKQLQQRQLQQLQLQQQQKQQQAAQLLAAQQFQHIQPMPDPTSDSKAAKQAAVMKQMILNQGARTLLQQLQQQQKTSSQPASSPQIASPPQMSPQSDMQSIGSSALQIPKVGTPLQAATPPFMAPSPSSKLEEPEPKPLTPTISTVTTAPLTAQSAPIGTPGFSVSPYLGEFTPSPQNAGTQDRGPNYHPALDERQVSTEPPLDRLIRAINAMSSKALASAVGDINSLVSLSDKLGGSAPGSQSRAAVGEDLAQVIKCRSQPRVFTSADGGASNRKFKRRIDSMALSIVSSNGSVVNSLQKLNGSDIETESTATSRFKRAKFEISRSLEEEINEINEQLIDTRVEIDDDGVEAAAAEGKEGIVLMCSYNAIALNPNVTFRSNLFRMVPISPLRLLIPPYYPESSPIVLVDHNAPDFNHPVSRTARDEFYRAVRCLPHPVMLGDMARAWDASARSAMIELATRQGGGCLSSTYGTWQSYVNA